MHSLKYETPDMLDFLSLMCLIKQNFMLLLFFVVLFFFFFFFSLTYAGVYPLKV